MKRSKVNISNGNFATSLYLRVSRYLPSYRILAIVGWSLLLIDLVFYHGSSLRVPTSPSVGPLPDVFVPRESSTGRNVKVLPSMEDEKLELLPPTAFSYIAMIDAGSSGCRVHVYRYGKVGNIDGPLYLLPKHVSLKVKPGLSSFAKEPNKAGESLKGLVDFVKEQVPSSDWENTPIWLKATAGLRMLPQETTETILNSVRDFLGNRNHSPLMFRPSWAKVIPGQEEGAFGWIAYNYLKRIIGPKRNTVDVIPYAVIEMGGASAQVTQLAPSQRDIDEIPSDFRYSFSLEGQTYTLYTHSYLGTRIVAFRFTDSNDAIYDHRLWQRAGKRAVQPHAGRSENLKSRRDS